MPGDILQQLIDAINNPANNQTTEAAPTGQEALNPFFNTPMYQLLYGANATQVDPAQRFKADPGYQFAQDEAMRNLQMSGAAKGLLESGPMQQELLRQSQGMADQNYQRFIGQQGTLYNNYQDRLAGLMGQGAQQSGADQTLASGVTLAQLLSGNYMGTGQNIASGTLGTGENISTLLGNQGVMNANLTSNTAAARANALMQAFGMSQQQQNNQQVSAAQQQSSGLQGLGALLGANYASGNGSGSYSQSNPWAQFF